MNLTRLELLEFALEFARLVMQNICRRRKTYHKHTSSHYIAIGKYITK